jgi:glutathione-regulated potassium-efflux system ancillary protein KefC
MEHAPAWLTGSLIYLGAAVLAVPLAQALGLGPIIGYLAAGIAIGPWGFGLVTDVGTILSFAEFGVVLMLFLVGLELEPKRLWAMRRPIFGYGTLQVVSCSLALFVVGLAVGVRWQVALVAGLGFALSSTAIAIQVLNSRNLLGTQGGRNAFSITLFQDVAALPILALLPLLGVAAVGAQAEAPSRWLEAAKIISVIGGIVLGGRLALRPVLRWIAKSDTPEIFTASALLLVVALAWVMHSVGLSMALGAFMGGVLLAESEYRRELETDIEPFKGLLLGLFFIAVGMSIDFGVLAERPLLIAALVLGFVAIKALVIWALGAWIGVSVAERPVFTLLLAQGGEFAFVVFSAALAARVFDADTASILIGSVAISLLLSPVLLVFIDKVIAPRLAKQHTTPMDELAEPQHAPVIVAGFGRYGQIIVRLLSAQGVPVTVLDHDVEMVDAARRFGYTVHYGDATRLDLLRTAGAEQATLLVVAVDAVDQSLAIVDLVQAHFPKLQMVVRARDMTHWNALRDRGVQQVDRELFESSVASGRRALELLGHSPAHARDQAMRFRRHNLELAAALYAHHKDEARLIAVAKLGRQQLEEQMAQERREREERRRRAQPRHPGWDAEPHASPALGSGQEAVVHQLAPGQQHAPGQESVKP